MTNDQILGKMEVCKKTVPVGIAMNRAPKANSVTLSASYQGCHEKLDAC